MSWFRKTKFPSFEKSEPSNPVDNAILKNNAPPVTKRKKESSIRNEEVTVEIDRIGTCHLNTATATHIGTRQYQQDAAYVCEPLFEPGTAFGILCDGMGGMADGERVSSDVVTFVANQIAALSADEEPSAFLEEVAYAANNMILEDNRKIGQNAGTTLAVALVRGNELYWLSVGDSRIYIIRKGEIARVTRDHNYALELQEMVKAGKITQQQADNDPRKDALVSYIGASLLEIVDVNRGFFQLEYGDIVLLCSDGLTKSMPDELVLDWVSKYKGDIKEAARILPLVAYDSCPNGMDNTTVILMQYCDPASFNCK